MNFHEFGKTGLTVSEIGFGGSRIGGFFADRNSTGEALNVLREALACGINFYDTADMYAQGESEALVGTAFRGQRDKVILATKGGYCLPAQRSILKPIKRILRPIVRTLGLKRAKLPSRFSGTLSQDFSPSHLTTALEGSLKRLKTDYVDLYQLHSPAADFIRSSAFGAALETLEKLKGKGMLRFYGVATEAPEDAPFCLSVPGISSIQLGFGLLDLQALDQGTLAAAKTRGLGIIARGCFAGGLLKQGLDEAQLKEATPKWQRILALHSISQSMRRPLLEMALQFCRGTSEVSVTLLGMRNEDHLRENLRYLQTDPLNSADYTALRRAQELEAISTAGEATKQ